MAYDIQTWALECNTGLGGSYVNGALTPPASWTGTVTQWSRYVQEYAANNPPPGGISPLPQSEQDAIHYGGYPAGSAEANAFIAQVQAAGWRWDGIQWVRSDTGYIYIPPEVLPGVITPVISPVPMDYTKPATVRFSDITSTQFQPWVWPFILGFGGLMAMSKSKSIRKYIKSKRRSRK